MAEDVAVTPPANPPVWTPRLARLMLRMLLEAKAKQDAEEVAA
jgi:hypothetical protein